MKKSLIILMCLMMLLVGCSNGGSLSNPQTLPSRDQAEKHVHQFGEWTTTKVATCTTEGKSERSCDCGEIETKIIPALGHDYKEATCTEPKTCKVCGQTEGSPLGHTTTTGVCSRCGEDFTVWDVSYYLDNFNQPTDVWYIYNKIQFTGTFSNSATNNSTLTGIFLVDADYVSLVLYEYGRVSLGNWTTWDQYYDVEMKDSNGNITTLTAIYYYGSDRLVFEDQYYNTIVSALKTNDTLSFYLVDRDHPYSNYLLEVKCANFTDVYNQYY